MADYAVERLDEWGTATGTDPMPYSPTGTADFAELPPAFNAALNGGDVDALIALFHPEATMRMTNGNVTAGVEALRPALGTRVSGRRNLQKYVRQAL